MRVKGKHLPIGDCTGRQVDPILAMPKAPLKTKIDIYVINKVREKRQEKKMSQAELAYELGMSVGFIGKVESSKYPSHYNLSHINNISKILNCSPRNFCPKNRCSSSFFFY